MAFSLFNFGAKAANTKNQVVEIPLKQIEPNRYQPRQVFDKVQIQELAHTIEEHGLLQPIILREYKAAKYEIIAGERRFRAMELLGWEAAPAIVEKMSDKESASLALIENTTLTIEFGRRSAGLQEADGPQQPDPSCLGQRVGKSQSAVANKLRLLNLIEPVQNAILDGLITERHGRALLGLTDDQQRKLLMRVVNEKLTVRQTEEAVAALQGEVLPTPAASAASITPAPASAAPAPATASAPVKQPQAKKAAPKKKAKISVSDPQIALNTIKKSVKLVKDNGFKTTVRQKKLPDGYQLTITVKPQATDHQDGEK